MNERLDIASRIASGLFAGVPYGLDDFEQTDELKAEEEKTVKAIARLSVMMAEALIAEEASRPTMAEVRMNELQKR